MPVPDAQLNMRGGLDIQEQAADGARPSQPDMGRDQLNKIGTVAAANDPDTLATPLAGLAARRGEHSIARGRRQLQCGKHQRAEYLTTARAAEKACAFAQLGRCVMRCHGI
jgi:hypothetical protein